MADGQYRTHQYVVFSYAGVLRREWNILFQNEQLHIAEGLRRSYNDSG